MYIGLESVLLIFSISSLFKKKTKPNNKTKQQKTTQKNNHPRVLVLGFKDSVFNTKKNPENQKKNRTKKV